MSNKTSKLPFIMVGAIIVVIIGAIILSSMLSDDIDNSSETNGGTIVTNEEAVKVIEKAMQKVNVTYNHCEKGTVTYESSDISAELPDIDTSYPLTVTPVNKDVTVEIFVSPEKSGTGTDSWMNELAEEFNRANNRTSTGKSVGIVIRSITSGAQIDYIKSGAYVPDAITPSASLWADMLDFAGIDLECINPRLVGNVAGILIDKSEYQKLETEYGKADIKAVITATEHGTLTAGYTNPFMSTTGLNFLASALYSYDASNPLSERAVEGFNKFQNNVPFVAYNTIQMRNAAENNTFTTFVQEYQGYYNNSDLKNNYEFIPFGVRHDNPLYIVGSISSDKREALEQFNDYCMTEDAQKKASSYGFNQLEDYKDSIPATDGNTWTQMQKVWKQNKNTAKPIAAVFVLDMSGSMSGEPINALKSSLTNSIKYINSSNYIGVVSYASGVNVDLPIGLFDINQQAYFYGAVDGLQASGNTATYSALAVAIDELNKFVADNPNVQPMIFLLSDGEANGGARLRDIAWAVSYYKTPIYTIGYNANLDELKKVSELNEAASIDADNDDVIYQLKNLFNANL